MAQKVLNGVFSSGRVPNEHAIAGVKRLRIVKDILRLRGQAHQTHLNLSDHLMELACALHNLRQHHRRPLTPIPLKGLTLYC